MKISISGIRGIFGDDFTLKDVLQYTSNFASLIKPKKCVIGNDTRPSSNMIKETATAALMQYGVDVYNLGMTATPVVFREARKYGAGLIVTSSHNPVEWNGLKFIIDGRGINEEELLNVTKKQNTTKTKIGTENHIESDYVKQASKIIGRVEKPIKVTVDVGGGAAKMIAPSLLEEIGCDVKTINKELEASSRGPDPTTDSLDDLISQTKGRDIGFAFDLDGDRLVVVYKGKKQSSDLTLGLGVAKALELGYKKFVLSIDSSISIEKFIRTHGGEVKRSKVGEANVIDLMQSTNSQAGGEGSSAGFILGEFNYCRDGILASGLIASMLDSPTFDTVIEFMKNYHQLRDKVDVESKFQDKTMDKLKEEMTKQFSKVINIDGIKAVMDDDTWSLVRKSNTEDIIRISTESNDLKKAKTTQNQMKELVNQCYEKVK